MISLRIGTMNELEKAARRTGMGITTFVRVAAVAAARRNKQKLLLSILWRASIATHPAFEAVDLGEKYEGALRRMLYEETPGPAPR